jgi:hypothetical protein
MMVTAVSALTFCLCSAITSSAQIVEPVLSDDAAEQVRTFDAGADLAILNYALCASCRTSEISLTLVPKAREEWSSPPAVSLSDNDPGKAANGPKSGNLNDPIMLLPAYVLDNHLRRETRGNSFDWGGAITQSLFFLGIQHGFRLATESGTRADLKGPFFRDYFQSVSNLAGWGDGDPFKVNYLGHPMMGSVAGFIQVHNDPKGAEEEVSLKKSYWQSRLKAFGWSFAYSTQFEIGMISEATIGNVGIRPYGTYGAAKHPMAYGDFVITPIVGTGWLIGEDLVDRYVISYFEGKTSNRTARFIIRGSLNPTRSFANLLRFKKPWYRDTRN